MVAPQFGSGGCCRWLPHIEPGGSETPSLSKRLLTQESHFPRLRNNAMYAIDRGSIRHQYGEFR
jgi:hypothetical protein